jgi:hypothetical protein
MNRLQVGWVILQPWRLVIMLITDSYWEYKFLAMAATIVFNIVPWTMLLKFQNALAQQELLNMHLV